MATEMNDGQRRDRLARDLAMLGQLGDPTRGPMARYYQPAQPQDVHTAPRAAPLAPWHCALAAIVARVHGVGGHWTELTWSRRNERRPAPRQS